MRPRGGLSAESLSAESLAPASAVCIGSGLLNAALPLATVGPVPAARAAMGAGAQQTLRGAELAPYGECRACGTVVPVPDVLILPGPGLDPDPADPVGRALVKPKGLLEPIEAGQV
ncbi:hypothetical protein [Streptomyces rishiriensis]|uniref:hypothetical protein n=1 Tax=Streptomyces rishiriensis TaxID=68264 RepID=UPI0027D8A55F|nr:hypothetical protein [Streptomyces rishiriensis]